MGCCREAVETLPDGQQVTSKHKVLSNATSPPCDAEAQTVQALRVCSPYRFGAGIFVLKVEVKPTWTQTLAAAQKWADEHRRPCGGADRIGHCVLLFVNFFIEQEERL